MSRSLLLVEDNEDDVFFFKAAAKKAGFSHDIVVASNGREAVDLLSRYAAGEMRAPTIGLVLLDIKMPMMSGLEVLEWIHGTPALGFLPVVMLTSSEQEEDIEEAYRWGAASFLVKPSHPDGLIEFIRTIAQYWLHHNRLPAAILDRRSAASARSALTGG